MLHKKSIREKCNKNYRPLFLLSFDLAKSWQVKSKLKAFVKEQIRSSLLCSVVKRDAAWKQENFEKPNLSN